MKDCIFCKIIAGEVPSEKTHHEDDAIVSFPDIHPVRPGHTLVVTAKHYQWFWELPGDVANDFFRVSRKMARELKEKTGADYVQLSIVGKDVPHVHAHLIPRTFGDTKALL
ncbi:TPA: HIT family protein [Candidatus Kaiserbacteria bacterium]|nr:MAG: Histidine triad (HIT) protein [Parcubacteria group bacterium GW2011_GWA1_56_13]KKW46975.1 MAG: Histidine triad (HIT) protein [Parcubacteria group bacterium GW2011_GWB1_57_6]HCR52437.1 HIT family protein [Candidatus Kaiserbacteria bacterium]